MYLWSLIMHPIAKQIHAETRQCHATAYNLLAQLRPLLDRCPNQGELANIAFALRKATELAEDMRKEIKRMEERAIKIACVLWSKDPTNMTGAPIRTDYVTASPRVTEMANLPRRGEPGYAELMNW